MSGVQCNTEESPLVNSRVVKGTVEAKWLTQGCYLKNSGRPQLRFLHITPDNG